jgi:hypothetical protein
MMIMIMMMVMVTMIVMMMMTMMVVVVVATATAVLHEPLTIDSSLAAAGGSSFSDYVVCILTFLSKLGSNRGMQSPNKPSFETAILSPPPPLQH